MTLKKIRKNMRGVFQQKKCLKFISCIIIFICMVSCECKNYRERIQKGNEEKLKVEIEKLDQRKKNLKNDQQNNIENIDVTKNNLNGLYEVENEFKPEVVKENMNDEKRKEKPR